MSLYRIRNAFIAALLIIAAYILQWTVFNNIPGWGYSPNLLLIVTFAYGYTSGKISGMLAGLFSGLIVDVFFCDVIGYYALILLITGYISGIWITYFYSDGLYIPMIILMGNELLYCIINFIVWHVLHAKFDLGYYLLHTVLPEVLLTFIAGILLFKPLSLLINRLKAAPEE